MSTRDEKTDDGVGKTPEKELWHFTDQNGLYPILVGPDGLMAGHVAFMSDIEDSLLCRRLNALAIQFFAYAKERSNTKDDETAKLIRKLKNTAQCGTLFPMFATCFTAGEPDEKHWIERTGNGGFAIRFQSKLFDELQHKYPQSKIEKSVRPKSELPLDDGGVFGECSYDSYVKELNTMAQTEEAVQQFKDFAAKRADPPKEEMSEADRIFFNMRAQAERLAFVKRPSFRWEKEYRLAYFFPDTSVPLNRLRFVGNRPFVTMELAEPLGNYVKEIRISPLGNVTKSTVIAHLVGAAIGLAPDFINTEGLRIC